MTTHKTRGIVLRAVKYGETSLIVSVYTELFGLQSYIVNGVRQMQSKAGNKASFFQPAALLDLVVYHNDLKHLQRIREYKWAVLYDNLFFNVHTNAVALYMIELLQKTLKQPESNPDLFAFVEDALLHLDKAGSSTVANFPLFFSLHLANFFGFRLTDNWSEEYNILDMQEGAFVNDLPGHSFCLSQPYSYISSQLLKAQHPDELDQIKMNQDIRRQLLKAYEAYYALHISDFGTLRTLPVLHEVLG